jgi:hypothetical protein
VGSMAASEARVRAPLTKAIVEMLASQPPRVQVAVREKAASALSTVDQASRVDWIPLGVQLEILSALHEEIGARDYDAFCTAHFASTVEQPLVKSVFEGTLRVFGLSPGAVYKMFGKSWSMISSGCGVVSIEGDLSGSGTVIHVRELPIAEPEIDLFVRGFRATFQGPIEVVKKRGNVELRSFDRAAREATYLATWS